ncbi:hypothetical protein JG687_00012476 [Phytophthora cactorum]|uniref:Elicitin n=1 Tax=Phytophthora cactorum TaxID=29920 RepID=A0A8T1G4R3_9STRA|nr:hypothetical protein Pcac1_g7402 [Phytophthora cactorum]KAG2818327.1 hypothetical protein PC111_g12349 [Phytophthora cactorum]KAG2824644.1 hypothetical protein PC112_g10020 [Phytophthora cactorum]KAG2858236.1 hypothetical protein PC113_g9976 [Phytophthora cactorum]KAG2906844.1 hypothetical protein PC114_g11015 [Phytophthora cactorum]
MSSSGSITTCSTTSLAGLLTNQYITQCSTDSGYSFTAASIPTQDVIDLMCASSACRGLLADAQALDLPECILPVGDNIRLRADLIDYVPARCPSASGSATAGSTTTTDSTVTASSTAGNDTASSADTITAPSTASSTTSSGETSTTATSAPATETSASAASASAASASSGSSAASSAVGRALSVMSLGALAVVTYFL